VFNHLAALHHEHDPLHGADVGQRFVIDGDDVGELAVFDGTP
jgi:hypothetical protein